MNTKVDATKVLEFLFFVVISYALSPIYIFLSGWDLADNTMMDSIPPRGLRIISTCALILLFTTLYKCRCSTDSGELISGELMGLIVISILPILCNLVYSACMLAGFTSP